MKEEKLEKLENLFYINKIIKGDCIIEMKKLSFEKSGFIFLEK